MKQNINIRLFAISIIAVLMTTIGVTLVYYELFQEQVQRGLKTEARIISEAGIETISKNQNLTDNEEIRITWISKTGEVLFDNDVQNLGNHLNRPEVIDAFNNGTGESVRESDTMNMRNFYYAMLLSDGTVLRVSTEARSLSNVFASVFSIVLLVILLIIIACVIIGNLLTVQLLEPIRDMAEDMDNINVPVKYKELSPFIDKIRDQHHNILAASKSRQDFTANVSHELKTPITAISGYAELIENKMVDEEKQIKFAKEIRNQADRLVSLVNDIIKLSELDSRELSIEFTHIDLYEIVKERIELLKSIARTKNIVISVSGKSSIVMSNKNLMVELIDNLVQNAIRYNKQNGKVFVDVSQNDSQTILTVEDTGIGIPKDDIDRVFERFYRVDRSRSRETGGTGLGLAIVKHIVELHDGQINLESEVKKGTKVTVIL